MWARKPSARSRARRLLSAWWKRHAQNRREIHPHPQGPLWGCWETLPLRGCYTESTLQHHPGHVEKLFLETKYRQEECAGKPRAVRFCNCRSFLLWQLSGRDSVCCKGILFHGRLERSWEPVHTVVLCTFYVNVICPFSAGRVAQTRPDSGPHVPTLCGCKLFTQYLKSPCR